LRGFGKYNKCINGTGGVQSYYAMGADVKIKELNRRMGRKGE
jgi:hypothetical protein